MGAWGAVDGWEGSGRRQLSERALVNSEHIRTHWVGFPEGGSVPARQGR